MDEYVLSQQGKKYQGRIQHATTYQGHSLSVAAALVISYASSEIRAFPLVSRSLQNKGGGEYRSMPLKPKWC